MHIKKDWKLYTKKEIEAYQRKLVVELRKITNPDGTCAVNNATITGYVYGKGGKGKLNSIAQCMQYSTPAELADLWTM